MGTAPYNKDIRYKLSLIDARPKLAAQSPNQNKNHDHEGEQPKDQSEGTCANNDRRRKKIPVAWERIVPYYNHSELLYVNQLALNAKIRDIPFPDAELLLPDNGERFFSHFLTVTQPTKLPYSKSGMCECKTCRVIAKAAGRAVDPPSKTTAEHEAAHETAMVLIDLNRQQKVGLAQPHHAANILGHDTTAATVNLSIRPVSIRPMAPVGFPMHIPMQMQMPTFFQQGMHFPQYYYPQQCQQQLFPTANSSCCSKHSIWLSYKKGRPPHDSHCPTKLMLRQQQQQQKWQP